ncbi:hypothetical protein GCM10023226_00320 [Nocardioides nanhaiensis]|uniref:Sulfotransferase family protein n=1 Tax=Nocardioides nanhaiensis TaxID=1476871 RepID=A0ABP8VRM5_9ACTN
MREGLRHLLDAPTYHMSEVFAHPEHAATWVDAIAGRPPDWESFLAGYAAGVDAPFSLCWRELADAYPDAPVLLSHRGDAELWYRSMAATVLPRTRELRRRSRADPLVALFEVLFDRVCPDIDDHDQLVSGYDRWLAQVREGVAPGRLVEWQPGDAWAPVCRALGLPVPAVPFPHENSSASYRARQGERTRRDRARLATASGEPPTPAIGGPGDREASPRRRGPVRTTRIDGA